MRVDPTPSDVLYLLFPLAIQAWLIWADWAVLVLTPSPRQPRLALS